MPEAMATGASSLIVTRVSRVESALVEAEALHHEADTDAADIRQLSLIQDLLQRLLDESGHDSAWLEVKAALQVRRHGGKGARRRGVR